MILFDGRQAHVFRPVALEQKEQDPDYQETSRRHPKGVTPAKPFRRIARYRGTDEAAQRVVGAPEAEDASALALGEKRANVLGQRRPAAGLTEPLNAIEQPEQRHGVRSPHQQGSRYGHEHAEEDNPARAPTVAQGAAAKLPQSVGNRIGAIDPRHVGLAESQDLGLFQLVLGDGKGLAGKIESGVRQPGDRENLPAPAFVLGIIANEFRLGQHGALFGRRA